MIMTQEQKDLKGLLLKDLCGRLPYGVKARVYNHWRDEFQEETITIENLHQLIKTFSIGDIKPYLFPLSSMTEEQCEELRNLIYEHFTLDEESNEGIRFKTYGDILVWLDERPINDCYFIFDYFNKNHFDYRGLFHKGLAIDCTNLNIY